ncbi:MAG: tRNA preQ1(34) S-adenosylmethionine ribosyltransferase-isomerase QueA [Candidatus Latescibacterota bacterium]
MELSDYEYTLPKELIAQHPVSERDCSRLLVLNRTSGEIAHRHFGDLISYLNKGDALVVNETKVFPARLLGEKEGTGAQVEVFLLRKQEEHTWETLVRPGRRIPVGTCLSFGNGRLRCQVIACTPDGGRVVRFEETAEPFEEALEQIGKMPLPPYIHRDAESSDLKRYQTVYAKEVGAVAAPTAGLHFTQELLDRIREKGVSVVPIVLHVGIGTFRPVSAPDPRDHPMEAEYYQVSEAAAECIGRTKATGGRIVAVGTTVVRTLETVATEDGKVPSGAGWTQKFLYPPYTFRLVDALVTNFHLPKSTLLMLVSAFAGRESVLRAYEDAIAHHYRFYSYGDAMLICDW